MEKDLLRLTRRIVHRLELLSETSLGVSSLSNPLAAEILARTIKAWGNHEWAEIAMLVAERAPIQHRVRSRVLEILEGRARVLREHTPRYRVRFYDAEDGKVASLEFEDWEMAAEFAAASELDGLAPAPIEVIASAKPTCVRASRN